MQNLTGCPSFRIPSDGRRMERDLITVFDSKWRFVALPVASTERISVNGIGNETDFLIKFEINVSIFEAE